MSTLEIVITAQEGSNQYREVIVVDADTIDLRTLLADVETEARVVLKEIGIEP